MARTAHYAHIMRGIVAALTLLVTAGCSSARVLFDDFSDPSVAMLARHGWTVRTEPGWPGVPGASWGPGNVTLIDDAGNGILRMSSSTGGAPGNTIQTQICHERKYLGGTYAARVRFHDTPAVGPNGDQIVETFYLVSPLAAPMDPDYSEIDFEYLPNGGWQHTAATMFETTWETFSPEPGWKADNVSSDSPGSLDGWHTLVTQVGDGHVRYWIDGRPVADHSGRYYPESMMSINFNLWFIRTGLLASTETRRYEEDIDWVFFSEKALTPDAVAVRVADLRQRGVRFRDTVLAPVPALPSPCNL